MSRKRLTVKDKYKYEDMDSIPKDESVTATAKRLGCSRQAIYDMKKKYAEEKRVKDMELQLKECKAKLKALQK